MSLFSRFHAYTSPPIDLDTLTESRYILTSLTESLYFDGSETAHGATSVGVALLNQNCVLPSFVNPSAGVRQVLGTENIDIHLDQRKKGGPSVASVMERVTDIVAEQLGVDKEKITAETSFVNDLGADSLDTVELVMELEEEFDINIPDDAAEKIQTVGQAIDFIEQSQANANK